MSSKKTTANNGRWSWLQSHETVFLIGFIIFIVCGIIFVQHMKDTPDSQIHVLPTSSATPARLDTSGTAIVYQRIGALPLCDEEPMGSLLTDLRNDSLKPIVKVVSQADFRKVLDRIGCTRGTPVALEINPALLPFEVAEKLAEGLNPHVRVVGKSTLVLVLPEK